MKQLKLKNLTGLYGIARLDASSPIPPWADGAGFVSISRSEDELSIVCQQTRIPDSVSSSLGWACFKLVGPFAFDETGIVASVVTPLSTGLIGVFVVSTYDGDHILIKSQDLERSRNSLGKCRSYDHWLIAPSCVATACLVSAGVVLRIARGRAVVLAGQPGACTL